MRLSEELSKLTFECMEKEVSRVSGGKQLTAGGPGLGDGREGDPLLMLGGGRGGGAGEKQEGGGALTAALRQYGKVVVLNWKLVLATLMLLLTSLVYTYCNTVGRPVRCVVWSKEHLQGLMEGAGKAGGGGSRRALRLAESRARLLEALQMIDKLEAAEPLAPHSSSTTPSPIDPQNAQR